MSLERLAELLRERNRVSTEIAALIGRPALNSHVGEYIASQVFDITELIDIRPNPGSVYVHSRSEPHNEEQRIDEERLDNWLRRFDVPRLHAHASGHANYLDLMRMVGDIKPKKLIPIHIERPELFKLIHENVEYPQLHSS